MRIINGKVGVFGVVALVVGMALGCGSSSSTPATSTGDDITVSGVIESPSGVSTSLSRGLGAKSLVDVAAADGHTCTLYDVEDDWELVGTGTTSAGTVSIDVAVDDIRPADETGDSYAVPLVLVCENDDGTIHLETYIEATVTEGTTTTIDLGTADIDSTLAAQALWRAAGCAIGTACNFTSIDPVCYFRSQHSVFSGSDAGGDGISDDTAAVRDMVRAAMAAGESPANYGYESWGDMMADALAGDLPADAQTAFAGHAQDFVEGAADGFYENGYAGGADALATLDNIFAIQLAGGEGASALTSISKQVTVAEESACDSIRDGALGNDYVDGLIETFLACEDPTECENVYGNDDCFNVAVGVVNEYREAGDFSGLQEAPAAVQGYISGLGSDGCAGFFDDAGALDGDRFNDLHEVFDSVDPADVQDHDALRDWGRSWEETISSQGFDALRGADGTFDDGRLDYYGEYFNEQVGDAGYDPTLIDFDALGGELEEQFDGIQGGGGGFSTCIDNGGTFESCGGAPPDLDEFEQDQPMNEPEFGGGFACSLSAPCDGGFQCIDSQCRPPPM